MSFMKTRRERPLTIREINIVFLIVDGFNPADMAAIMDISKNSVRNHISNINHKWGTYGRASILAEAWRQGLGNVNN